MTGKKTAPSMPAVFFLVFFVVSLLYAATASEALACGSGNKAKDKIAASGDSCGWGRAGGDDFIPGKSMANASYKTRKLLSLGQANEIIKKHLAGLNPNLRAGRGRDAGRFYRFEILVSDKPVEQLAVDKTTGSIRQVN